MSLEASKKDGFGATGLSLCLSAPLSFPFTPSTEQELSKCTLAWVLPLAWGLVTWGSSSQ